MDGIRTSRRARVRGVALLALGVLWTAEARATFCYGDIQISGNVQTQNLLRIQDGTNTFNSFHDVQQRNTRCSSISISPRRR